MMNRYRKLVSAATLVCFLFGSSPAAFSLSDDETKKQVNSFYKWILFHSNQNTELPSSHVGDPRLKEWCHTYDAAVCVLAFLAVGDVPRAKKIMDFYVNKELIRRLGGVIEAVLNFSKDGKGIDWQVRTGTNMWIGIASFHMYLATKDPEYLIFAQRQADFALSIQNSNPVSVNYGGIPLGPRGVPYNPKDQHILWEENAPEFVDIYSTEANISAWALLNMVASESSDPKYKVARKLVWDWLETVGFNAGEKRFNVGYYKDPDMRFNADTHFWAISAFGPDGLNKWEQGLAHRFMEYAKDRTEVEITYKNDSGQEFKVKGYDFIDKEDAVSKLRGPMVSPEWTFRAAVAYSILADHEQNEDIREYYLSRREELIDSVMQMAKVKEGIASFPYASKGGAPIANEYSTPAPGHESVIGGAWAILALLDYDPLNLEKIQKRYSQTIE